jgi:hypothetical protein
MIAWLRQALQPGADLSPRPASRLDDFLDMSDADPA